MAVAPGGDPVTAALALVLTSEPTMNNGKINKYMVPPPGTAESEEERPNVKGRQYVICHGTSDYPGKYTVRKHLIFAGWPEGAGGWTRPAELLGYADTLEAARKLVPANAGTQLPVYKEDDPVIVEAWM